MSRQARLLDAHVELTASIRASEPWEKSYTDSPTTLKRLVREEALLQRDAAEYFLGLRDRVETMVNWSEVRLKPVQAAAVPPESDESWQQELALFTAALGDHMIELYAIGANAGEDLYDRPVGFSNLSEAVIDTAGRYTAGMVTGITNTTRGLIQRAIQQSIARGEDYSGTLARIQRLIANPVRAEMIAQTEGVNAYQSGLDLFGEATGVKSWTWDALVGACKLCAPIDGVTKKVGHLFTLGNGVQVARPAAHTRCRCGRIANYDK